MAPVRLLASPNDFLLEQALKTAVEEVCAGHGVEPEELADDAGPSDLAFELRSPSLFASARVLVAPRVAAWIAPPVRRRGRGGRPAQPADGDAGVELGPLLEAISEGVGEDVTLLLGACCKDAPSGPLVEAVVDAHGEQAVTWLPLPEKPKPWEDAEVSAEQARVLRAVVARAAPGARFDRGTEELLFERLGFDPRRLAAEAAKLATAAAGSVIDEDLVRRLVLPHERSLQKVEAAVFERRAAPVLEVLAAVARGESVRDWWGEDEIAAVGVLPVLLGGVSNMLVQLLAVRRAAVGAGLEAELDPRRSSEPYWYPRRFKPDLGPRLEAALADDPDRLHARGRKPPTLYQLGGLFAGASRWPEADLVSALIAAGEVEAALRGPGKLESMSAFVTRWLAAPTVLD